MAQNQIETDINITLEELLPMYLAQVGWSERQLAKRANIPRGTVRNWCKGLVARPRHWRRLVQAAAAMRLDEAQANELLRVAGHPSLARLNTQAKTVSDQKLLSFWANKTSTTAVFQAIPDLPYFVGREEEVAALKTHLLQDTHRTIYVLTGMGGIGKTSLAAHLAYAVRDHFVDGVLWARVDTSDTMSLLKMMADTYDQDVSQFTDIHSRSQVVRTVMARKQALLILDNVESSRQIQPLLPPNGPCAVLITSRYTNLQIARGCPHIHLRSFRETTQFSSALFAKIMGKSNASAEQKTLAEIADLLGHLPLALAIAAGRIAYEPHGSPHEFLSQLKTEKSRLDALTYEDQSVQTSLNASFTALTPQQKQFFAALGVLVGEDFSLDTAVALNNISTEKGRAFLVQLYNLSLVQAGRSKRYRLHPLLREFARAKLTDASVNQRMAAYYAEFVKENQRNYRALEQETDNIIAAINLAFDQKMVTTGIEIVVDFSHYLKVTGQRELANALLQRAEQAAQQNNDTGRMALVKCAVGNLKNATDPQAALASFEEGLRLAYASENEKVIAIALKDLGLFYETQSDFERAVVCIEKSLVLVRQTGQHKLMGFLLNNLASAAINHKGDYQQAEKLFLEGLKLQREHKNLPATSLYLMNLSTVAYCLGDYSRADQYVQESEAIAEQLGYQFISAVLTRHRADLLAARQGDYVQGQRLLLKGERIARELQRTELTGFVLAALGEATAWLGDYDHAVSYLEEAQALAEKSNRRDIASDAWRGLGFVAAMQKQMDTAVSHFQKAFTAARASGDVWFLGRVLEYYGAFMLEAQEIAHAQSAFEELLVVGEKAAFLELIGAAQFGLARTAEMQGNQAKALRLGKASKAAFSAIGHHKAAKVHSWLDNGIG